MGGLGFIPFAPGTVGSLAGVGLFWLFSRGGSLFPLVALLFISVAAVWSSGSYGREVGRNDPQEVIVDELAGQIICLLGSPLIVVDLVAGFLLFRLFDIWKPIPRAEDLPGGWGILADDIVAGVLGWVVLSMVRYLGYL